MSDPAHKETDRLLAEAEKRIAREFKQANEEVQAKLTDYLRRYEKKDERWREWVQNGEKTAEEYNQWRVGQMAVGERWREMRDTLAQDYHNANKIAMSTVKGYMPEVYALNHNYTVYEIEEKAEIRTLYTLYSRETVENLMRDTPDLLPAARKGSRTAQRLAANKDLRWNRSKINSALLQGILQGESIPKIAKRMEKVTDMNHSAALRNARTMMTGAQNSGRMDAMEYAEGLGLTVKKQWLATLDSRTRHSHRQMDGISVEWKKKFPNGLMYPGDQNAKDVSEVYNCRCTMITQYAGYESDYSDLFKRNTRNFEHQSYEEWKKDHASKSNPIDLPERKGEAIKGAYTRKYRNGLRKLGKDDVGAASRFHVNKDDQLYENLQQVKPIEGYEDFGGHGKPFSIEYETTNGMIVNITASDYADILREDPSYKGGNIRLLACSTGSVEDGFAQQLANELKVNVMAPTETLWVDENGKMFVSNSAVLADMWYDGVKVNPTGKWRLFKPE